MAVCLSSPSPAGSGALLPAQADTDFSLLSLSSVRPGFRQHRKALAGEAALRSCKHLPNPANKAKFFFKRTLRTSCLIHDSPAFSYLLFIFFFFCKSVRLNHSGIGTGIPRKKIGKYFCIKIFFHVFLEHH